MLRNTLRFLYNDVKGAAVKYYRTREVIRVLELTHAQELRDTPPNLWPLTKSKQAHEIAAARDGKFPIVDRRTWSFPYLPESLHRLHQPLLKNTPYQLRRFSETPVPRRAINLIKNTIVALPWEVKVKQHLDNNPERAKRIRIVTNTLQKPNKSDSFRTLLEAVIEDILVGGYGCIEPAMTPSAKRPFKLWPVDGSTIRIFADWTESTPERPKYAQMTGMRGERGVVTFRADELLYIKDNVRTSTPFGLGKLETVFNTVNAFLAAQDAASNAGGDQIHKTFFWWRGTNGRGHMEQVKRYLRNEAEGQSKVSLMQGMEKPDIVEVNPVTPEDLLIEWQEFLIRIIATGFDLSPQNFGLERDVNRNTSETMAIADFRSAVVPVAIKIAEAITRFLLNEYLDWKDIEFAFIGLEDPDILTKIKVAQIRYQCDSMTSNDIRKEFGDEDIQGGFHDLTIEQKKLLLQKVQSDAKAAQMQQGMMPPDQGFGGGGGFGNEFGGSSFEPMFGSIFSAQQVAEMSPEQIEQMRELGAVPNDPTQLKQSMEEQEPGILQTLSEEVLEYFEYLEKEKKKVDVQPAKIKAKDKKEQLERYRKNKRERFKDSKNNLTDVHDMADDRRYK